MDAKGNSNLVRICELASDSEGRNWSTPCRPPRSFQSRLIPWTGSVVINKSGRRGKRIFCQVREEVGHRNDFLLVR